jgi:hypothetical protein
VSNRSTWILLLLAVSLGAFVYFYELRGEEQRVRAQESQRRVFPGIEASEIAELSVTAVDSPEVRVERRASSWQIVEPVDFPGDDVALDAMANTLAELLSEGEIEAPEALTVYGLGEDSRAIRFGTEGGDHVLRLGSKTPVGVNIYVAAGRPGAPGQRVYMVSRWRAASLVRGLDELRDRRVLHFDPEAVQALELVFRAANAAGASVRLDREGAGWGLSSLSPLASLPPSGSGDSGRFLIVDEVERLLEELARIEASSIEAESMGPEELSALGLWPARLALRVFGAESESEAAPVLAAVAIGDADPRQPGVFAQASGRDVVYRIDSALRDRIPLDYEAFAGRLLAPSPDAAVETADAAAPRPAEAAGREGEDGG